MSSTIVSCLASTLSILQSFLFKLQFVNQRTRLGPQLFLHLSFHGIFRPGVQPAYIQWAPSNDLPLIRARRSTSLSISLVTRSNETGFLKSVDLATQTDFDV